MKKCFLFVCLLILFILLLPKAEAVRIVCSNSHMSKMRAKAYKVTASYEFVNDDGDRYFLVRIANVEKGLEIRIDNNIFKNIDNSTSSFEYKRYANEMTNLKIEIYGAYGYPCVGELLYTKTLNLPKYNIYSEKTECIEYEEFPFCSKWYQGTIKNDSHFYTELNAYIDSLKPKEEKEIEKEGKNIFQKIADFYVEHIVYTGILTVICVVGLCYYVIKKLIDRKNRVKINFKG